MAALKPPSTLREFPLAFIQQCVALSTAGFGVVVALAWNQLIQEVIKTCIAPFFGTSSGIISMLIYAVAVTLLAIIVTMQLLHVQARLEGVFIPRQSAPEVAKPKPKTQKRKRAAK